MEIYKRIILILTMGIMAIGLITYKIEADSTSSSKKTVEDSTADTNNDNISDTASDITDADSSAVSPIPEDNSPETEAPEASPAADPSADIPDEPTPTPEPNPLKCEVYPEIHTLIEKYFQARLSCSIEEFKDIVTDVDYINIETITRATESVRDYTDCTVYTKRGFGNIDLVAYCTFNMIVPKVDSPVASMEVFYIVYGDDGNPRIFTGELDDDVYEKLISMDNDVEVLALKNYVETEIQHAMEKDESLSEFWDKMMNHITIDELEQKQNEPTE